MQWNRHDKAHIGQKFLDQMVYRKGRYPFFFFLCLFIPLVMSAQIANNNPQELQNIDIEEHLGETIPLDLQFVNHRGQEVSLAEYFHQDKPVLLTLAYYECPMLCTLVLNGIRDVADSLSWMPGKDYQIVTVSIDPREGPGLARTKHDTYLKNMEKQIPPDGWEFLVGKEDQSRRLADALGFKYYYVRDNDIYAHPAVSFVLTENGKITRYLYGINLPKRDVRLALLEGSQGKVSNAVDKLLLYCYQYSPDEEGYVLMAGQVMKLGGILTVVILGTVLGIFWWREHQRSNENEA